MNVQPGTLDENPPASEWQPLSFDKLPGWIADDHEAALSCFRMSAAALTGSRFESRSAVLPPPALIENAKAALTLDPGRVGREAARSFFESNFRPYRNRETKGFVTGYYEPEIEASPVKTDEFQVPLYKRPDDLVAVSAENKYPSLPDGFEFGRKTTQGVIEFFDRAQIEKGALKNRGLELFWLRSAIDAFFIHIQGSARLLFSNGDSVRISYAGKTGHPFTPIGKLLVEMGELDIETISMQTIRDWLGNNPKLASGLMQRNRSFIFFQEVENHDPQFGPIAAAGVQITPGRSIAIDKDVHAYGTPIWINTNNPLPMSIKPFQRLMIAQDTGSAIVGAERGDLFIGSGDEAGTVAGAIKHSADFVMLHPVGPKGALSK